MLYTLKKHLELDLNLIIESNFKEEELLKIQSLIEEYRGKSLALYLYGDHETLYERYQSRQENRHRAHQSVGEITLDQFKKSMEAYSKSFLFGDVMSVDTTSFTPEDYQTLKDKIIQSIRDQ